MIQIDWSANDKWPEMTCTCVCDHVFRSHSKFVFGDGLVSRKPCPNCGGHELRASRSDPEKMTL